MKHFDLNTLIAAVALAGLAAATAYVNADNSLSSDARGGTALVGAAAAVAVIVHADG